jgi:hypothetical protein
MELSIMYGKKTNAVLILSAIIQFLCGQSKF